MESRHLALCEGMREYGGPSGFLGSIVPPHRSDGDVFPLNRKELRQHILVSTGSTLGYLLPLLVQAYIVLYPLLACVLVVVASYRLLT